VFAAVVVLAGAVVGAAPREPEKLDAAEVLRRAADVLGGETALRRAFDAWFESIAVDSSSGTTAKSRVRVYQRAGPSVRIETSIGDEKIVVGTNGRQTWFVRSGVVADAPPELQQTLRTYQRRNVYRLVLESERAGTKATNRGIETIGSRTAHAIEFVYEDGERGVLWFDALTFLPVAAESREGGVATRTFYDDYRAVCGVRMSYHSTTERDGKRVGESLLLYFEAGGSLPDALFDRPRDLFAPRGAR
jgi:hypothetical protein